MDLTELNKDELKEVVQTTAEGKDFELPKGWHLMGEEKLINLAEEIKAYVPKVPEDAKEYSEPKIKGRTDIKSKILECNKVSVYIPEDIVNNTNHVNVWVNGVEFIYAREKDYMMPEPVAEVFMRAQKAEREARKRMKKFSEIK